MRGNKNGRPSSASPHTLMPVGDRKKARHLFCNLVASCIAPACVAEPAVLMFLHCYVAFLDGHQGVGEVAVLKAFGRVLNSGQCISPFIVVLSFFSSGHVPGRPLLRFAELSLNGDSTAPRP